VTAGILTGRPWGLITSVGLITINASTYTTLYSHQLYERLASWLNIFERKDPHRERQLSAVFGDGAVDIGIFGVGRCGTGIARALRTNGCRVICVDYNLQRLQPADAMGYPVFYGAAEVPEFIASLPLAHVRWVVGRVRERHVDWTFIHSLRSMGYAGQVAGTAHDTRESMRLEEAGADLVLMPYADADADTAAAAAGEVAVRLSWQISAAADRCTVDIEKR